MKTRLWLILLALVSGHAIGATTATVSPGDWALYAGTSISSRGYATEAACVDAAKALGVARSYTCRTSTGVVVSVTVDPPPPPPPPAVAATLTASPQTVASGGASSLTWSSTGATSCTLSAAGQSQAVPTAGSVSTGPLTQTVTVTLTCGSASDAETITVASAPPPPPADSDGDGVPDSSDACPTVAASTSDGCPVAPPPPPPPPGPVDPIPTGARYASPTGSGSACSDAAPCSFDTALSVAGVVVLKDGVYPGVGWNGSAEPRRILSGSTVRAQNAGGAVINGVWIGRSTRKDSGITVRDVRIEGGATLYNTQRVTLKNVGVHGPLDVGTNDHANGNTDNLIEDVWVWASGQRIIAINYRADRNVWRRVIVRGDGCGTAACAGSGNPNVGVTIYDSADVSFQNVIVLDRVLASGDSPYADFACAQHTPNQYLWGRNEWLGVISLNAPDQALYCEPDQVIAGAQSARIVDSVFWNGYGLNLARQGRFAVDGVTITNKGGSDGVRVAPELSGSGTTVTRVTVGGSGRYAVNSAVAPSQCNVSGSWQSAYNQTSCASAGTAAATWTLPKRYGVDGSRFGDAGVNAAQGALLPWPNDARIRAEMCIGTSRGLCSSPSVTEYLRTR